MNALPGIQKAKRGAFVVTIITIIITTIIIITMVTTLRFRCKARLVVSIAKTGPAAVSEPKREAPKFTQQLQPVISAEGQPARFQGTYTGTPGV